MPISGYSVGANKPQDSRQGKEAARGAYSVVPEVGIRVSMSVYRAYFSNFSDTRHGVVAVSPAAPLCDRGDSVRIKKLKALIYFANIIF